MTTQPSVSIDETAEEAAAAYIAHQECERFWRARIAEELRSYGEDMKSGVARDIVTGCAARAARGPS